MAPHDKRQREVLEIILAISSQEATEAQRARLNQLVLEDKSLALYAVQLLHMEGWLNWRGSQSEATALLKEWGGHPDGQPDASRPEADSPAQGMAKGEAKQAPVSKATDRPILLKMLVLPRSLPWLPRAAAAVLLVGAGILIGGLKARWSGQRDGDRIVVVDAGRSANEPGFRQVAASYSARLVNATACVWTKETNSQLQSQSPIQPGESLNLVAGLAELGFIWPTGDRASLRLEGPARLVLTTDGSFSLNYGKLTSEASLGHDLFRVETPAGQVVVTGDTHFAVAVFNGAVEVHVFKGQADFFTPWNLDGGSDDKLRIQSGRSIRMTANESGEFDISRGPASLDQFASKVSMTSDPLDIPAEYVEAIKRARPIVYWRFNRLVNDLVPNEMGADYAARVIGKLNWLEERGSAAVEFGGSSDAFLKSCIASAQPLHNLNGSAFTIEFWAKPSHYHEGTMVSLRGADDVGDKANDDGAVLLELGAQRAYDANSEAAGRIRFVHRQSVGDDVGANISCYSNEPYLLRAWQHIVAVKDKSEIRLYVDGKLTSAAPDSTSLSNDPELVLGQIDKERNFRPFVGQLDEFVFYDYALNELDIQEHYRMARPEVVVDVHVDKPTVRLNPLLYGLSLEDINYAADGGLYAELVQNRSFEYYPVEGTDKAGSRLTPLFAWEKVEREGGAVDLQVASESPLNEKNTKYLKMSILREGVAGVRNTGFGGMSLKEGAKYNFSTYARRAKDVDRPLQVALENADGTIIGAGSIPALGREWEKYELTLTASETTSNGRLALTTGGTGDVMLDMVSLFPQDTFKGRKNGLRKDLAQALVDLHPGFLRFPGGCLVHGTGIANAYRWKDTVGDVAQRKPNWNLWGYHQTYGLGYFEYLQLCEDIGATPLPVVPVGVSCGFRRPFDFVPMEDLHIWVDDALDLIEFANGPVDSQWGKLRAEMGHPETFGLKYICLGNEEHDTPEVRERFPYFVEAIRNRYPEIKLIGFSGAGPDDPLSDLMAKTNVYSFDEHHYMHPDWYLNNTHRFDTFDRRAPKVFIGEYASEGNAQFNAVAEAAYLTGVERNADLVEMTAYAPLLAKIGRTQWNKANLIWFTNNTVVKTPNYYVQQLFSTNKGDFYLENTVEKTSRAASKKSYAGNVGIGTWRTRIEVSSATLNDKPLDFSNWHSTQGDFAAADGGYTQRDRNIEAAISIAPQRATGENDVYRVRVRKIDGDEGFLIVFGYENDSNYYWWNVGGWGNAEHAIEQRIGGQSQGRIIATRGNIESNRWYDLRVELSSGRIRCYLDDKLIHDFRPDVPEVRVSSTLDKSTGDLIVKLVNPAEDSAAALLRLQGNVDVGSEAFVTTLAGSGSVTNSVSTEKIHPVKSTLPAAKTMTLDLPPTSVQIMRVKVK